jgi:hypothetical protein
MGANMETKAKRILFIDSQWIQSSRNVAVTVNPPEEQQVVMSVDRPWESQFIAFYVSVLEDAGRYRMWYTCRDKEGRGNVAYAESADGINWNKPELGIVEYEGSYANNLVGISSLEGTVIIDPLAPAESRYKYLTTIFKEGIYLYTSPDGIHWNRERDAYLPFNADSQIISFYDERKSHYKIYLRGWESTEKASAERKRTVVFTSANTLTGQLDVQPDQKAAYLWKGNNVPAITKELSTVFRCDDTDDASCDVYTMAAMAYPLDRSYYIAFPALYAHAPVSSTRKFSNDGRTEVHFIGSKDGETWNRYNRVPYWKPGVAGAESSEMVYAGYGMFHKNNQLWHYGTGYATTHGDIKGRIANSDGVVMLLKHRLDGFVSADTDYTGGEFTTSPIECAGNRLVLNLDTAAAGYAKVEIVSEEGQIIEGFSADRCDMIQKNSTDCTVTWNGDADVSVLAGKQIKLRVISRCCKMYSLRFEHAL